MSSEWIREESEVDQHEKHRLMGRQSTSADVWGKLFHPKHPPLRGFQAVFHPKHPPLRGFQAVFHPKHPPLRGFQAVVDAGLESAFGLSNIAPTAVWKPRSDEWLA